MVRKGPYRLLGTTLAIGCGTAIACGAGGARGPGHDAPAAAAASSGPETSGATRAAAARPPLRTTVYDCSGRSVVAHFADPSEVVLFLPGRTVFLPARPAASGTSYSDGTIHFRTKGRDEALLQEGDAEPLRCRVDHRASLWEDAKLRGVSYRATGNEPGWVLEIGAGGVAFEYDYGASRVEFPPLEPVVDAGRRETRYAGASRDHAIEVLIEGSDCRDSMSGESFASRVLVTLDGRDFHGCGRALH